MERIDREVAHALDAAVRLARDGLVTEALAACSLVLKNDPGHRAAWRTRAHLLARERAWSAAVTSVSCIIDDVTPDATDLLSRARWRLELGDIDGAMGDLSALLALGFESGTLHWRALARLLRAVAAAKAGSHARVLRESQGLHGQASVRVAGRRWRVRDMRRDAETALRRTALFPYVR